MEIYLIRHTTPAVEHGVCYGQSDIDVAESFEEEAKRIAVCLPSSVKYVISSPLKRCKKLAELLFPHHDIVTDDDLKEIHFGKWELQKWNDIPQFELQPWMNDFVHTVIPGGESYLNLQTRALKSFDRIVLLNVPTTIITHGGVIRSILSHITNAPLQDSFTVFPLHYGCVVKVTDRATGIHHEVL